MVGTATVTGQATKNLRLGIEVEEDLKKAIS